MPQYRIKMVNKIAREGLELFETSEGQVFLLEILPRRNEHRGALR